MILRAVSVIRTVDGLCTAYLNVRRDTADFTWTRIINAQAPMGQSDSSVYMLMVSHRASDPSAPENSLSSPNITTALLRYTPSLSSPDFLRCLLTIPFEAISCEAISLSSDDKNLNITYVNREGHCIRHPLIFSQPSDIETSPVVSNDEPRPAGSHLLSLPQLHAFRALATRSVESLPLIGNGKKSLDEARNEPVFDNVQSKTLGPNQEVIIGDASAIGQLFEPANEVLGAILRGGDGRVRGAAWTSDKMKVRSSIG